MSQERLKQLMDEVLRDLQKMQSESVEKMRADMEEGRKPSDEDRALLYKLNQTVAALERNLVPPESWIEEIVKARQAKDGE